MISTTGTYVARDPMSCIALFILACALFIGAAALYQRWRNSKD